MAATRWPSILCAVLLLLAGCASPKAEKKTRGLARIVDTAELRVGTSGEQPPLTMTTRSGALVGLDIAFARVLAQAMGVEPKFVRLPFGRLIEALEAGEVDLVMSGMTITPARMVGVDDRVGSLEVGKDADLVLWSGRPFELTSKIVGVVLNGELVYDARDAAN